ncbi:g7598 [Coccomyxa viridis]|uniref:G7598 protein n=1 Tax=Coccomyxa viridis TaxID=1274662 RepID=A0ABP1FY80_9CHLO
MAVLISLLSRCYRPPQPYSGKAFHRHLRLLFTASLLFGAQAEFRGRLKEPESLFKNATDGITNKVTAFLPASKGDVQGSIEAALQQSDAQNSELRTEFQEYKNETTAVINSLVGKINSQTPEGQEARVRVVHQGTQEPLERRERAD